MNNQQTNQPIPAWAWFACIVLMTLVGVFAVSSAIQGTMTGVVKGGRHVTYRSEHPIVFFIEVLFDFIFGVGICIGALMFAKRGRNKLKQETKTET